jgi:hypothetical protein
MTTGVKYTGKFGLGHLIRKAFVEGFVFSILEERELRLIMIRL